MIVFFAESQRHGAKQSKYYALYWDHTGLSFSGLLFVFCRRVRLSPEARGGVCEPLPLH